MAAQAGVGVCWGDRVVTIVQATPDRTIQRQGRGTFIEGSNPPIVSVAEQKEG